MKKLNAISLSIRTYAKASPDALNQSGKPFRFHNLDVVPTSKRVDIIWFVGSCVQEVFVARKEFRKLLNGRSAVVS
jgi:hypothetical protein